MINWPGLYMPPINLWSVPKDQCMAESPCTAVCTLDVNDICLGCYRTAEEIANWSQMNDEERKSVIDRINNTGAKQ